MLRLISPCNVDLSAHSLFAWHATRSCAIAGALPTIPRPGAQFVLIAFLSPDMGIVNPTSLDMGNTHPDSKFPRSCDRVPCRKTLQNASGTHLMPCCLSCCRPRFREGLFVTNFSLDQGSCALSAIPIDFYSNSITYMFKWFRRKSIEVHSDLKTRYRKSAKNRSGRGMYAWS